jgi:hypothetical protein
MLLLSFVETGSGSDGDVRRSPRCTILPLPFFALLVGAFLVVVALIQFGILRYAYLRIGVSSRAAMALMLGSLIGSYINIPIVDLPEWDVQPGVEASHDHRHIGSGAIGTALARTQELMNRGAGRRPRRGAAICFSLPAALAPGSPV